MIQRPLTRCFTRLGRAAVALSLASVPLSGSVARAQQDAGASDAPAAHVVQDNVTVDVPTDALIKGALKFLAAKQNNNGSWTSGDTTQHATAITAYTLMAFMATGNLPDEGEYGRNVSRGVQFLLDSQLADGQFSGSAPSQYMYGHGIATIALAEVYGQGKSPALKPKLEAAVRVILGAQNPQGGWRYTPRPVDADISVTVLQVVALRAAKNSGIDVPQTTIDKAVHYVKSCNDPTTGGFSYQPHSGAGFARTAAAIYSLQVCGLYDDPMVKAGSEYLFHSAHHGGDSEWFSYGNFYAAPAQYMIGGDTWKNWYPMVHDRIVAHAKREGDYVMFNPIDNKNGMVYATAVYTMILAMPYHYIPLYQR